MIFLYSITTGRSCKLIFLIVWHFSPILSQYSKTFAVISAFAGGSAGTYTSITAVTCIATVGVSAVVNVSSVPGVVGVLAVWHPGNIGVRTVAIIPGNASVRADAADVQYLLFLPLLSTLLMMIFLPPLFSRNGCC
jgi:hypothetical protein